MGGGGGGGGIQLWMCACAVKRIVNADHWSGGS